jgi:cytochrome c oxidase accessory protein FixG
MSMDNLKGDPHQGDGSFRDSVATINQEGKRNWVYPQKPKGKLYKYRTYISWGFLALLFTLPLIKLNGEPLFLINILQRKFILFGVIFWPQDFFIFMLGMLTFMVFIVLFTIIFGRVFCGWVCPQTIFLEMVFRKIEYLIEGDAGAQKALNKAPWSAEKIRKRVLKHTAFFALSFLIANTFLSYIISFDQVKDIYLNLEDNVRSLIGLIIFTFVFYGVFSWFREQVCLIVCPYGRLQGVLLDKKSIVVAYDYIRGEPREHLRKTAERKGGDCIDCGLCVRVCPTGIDIRNGTQLECVNCTACIDACDGVMESIGKPTDLIRYDSEDGIAKGEKLRFTPRMRAYSVVLALLVGVLVFLLATRDDVQATVLRASGMLYQEQPDSITISNIYNLKLLNKTHNQLPVELKLEDGIKGSIKLVGSNSMVVPKEASLERVFFIYLNKADITERKMPIKIGVYANGKKIDVVKTNFLGPFMRNKK